MKYEISSGGVVFKKKGSSIYILLLLDKNNNWSFPKGAIEENETMEETAIREISEETNLKKLKLIKKLIPIQYYYKFENNLIKKTVHYFLFEEKEEETLIPQKEEGIQEVKWFPIEEVKKILGYKKTNEKIIAEVKNIIFNHLSSIF